MIAVRIAQFLLSLTILVVLHELGHYTFARLFKTRVNNFYMFFNPWFSLVKLTPKKGTEENPEKRRIRFFSERSLIVIPTKGKDTEWGIGWVPLGGYCSIDGMVDETQRTDKLSEEAKPWEFRSKKSWQRLLIISGGVLVNFLLALFIYIMLMFCYGEEYIPLKNAQYGMQFSEVAQAAGFQNGDIIISVNNQPVERTGDFVEAVLLDGNNKVTVLRDGKHVTITLPADFTANVLKNQEAGLMDYRFPFVVAAVEKGSIADKVGMQPGDSLVAINGTPTIAFQDVRHLLEQNANKTIEIVLVRNQRLDTITMQLDENARMGVQVKSVLDYIPTERKEYGFFASVPAGISQGINTLVGYVKQFKLVFTPEGAKSMGGFITIGKLFPEVWDWYYFWNMTAFLSVILAFMNILPIPGLDGGYILFILYEMITGRKPSDKFLERAVTIGFILLLLLLIWANGNDIIRLFK